MSHVNPLGVPLLDVGRDVHGRFTKANPGGPGNPFARKVAALRKALLDSVSEQDLKDMIEALKRQALEGDKAAIKLILQYCVGKPEPPKDPDRMDVDEWDRLRQMSVGEEQFNKTMDTFPACLACLLAGTYWPCNAQEGPLAQTIHDVHERLRAGAQPPTQPGPTPAGPTPESKAPASPAAPAEPRPADAKRERHSPAQPPSPNGGNLQEQQRLLEHLRRLAAQSRPPAQDEHKPPRG